MHAFIWLVLLTQTPLVAGDSVHTMGFWQPCKTEQLSMQSRGPTEFWAVLRSYHLWLAVVEIFICSQQETRDLSPQMGSLPVTCVISLLDYCNALFLGTTAEDYFEASASAEYSFLLT